MKRFLISLVLLLTCGVTAHAQTTTIPGPVTYAPSVSPDQQNRIVIFDCGDPVLNGKLARMAMERAGMVVQLGVGQYDFGTTPCRLGFQTIVAGIGCPQKVVLFNTGFDFSSRSCCFELDNNTIENVTLEGRVGPGQQSNTVGHAGLASAINSKSELRNAIVIGPTFAVYNWGNDGNTLLIDRCKLFAGRIGVMAGRGSGPDSQFITINSSEITCDWEKYGPGAGGDIGSRSIGVFVRGGVVKVKGTKINIVGADGVDLAAGIAVIAGGKSEHNPYSTWKNATPTDFPYQWPYVYGDFDNKVLVRANGARFVADIIQDIGTVKQYGGSGSGLFGKWQTIGNVSLN